MKRVAAGTPGRSMSAGVPLKLTRERHCSMATAWPSAADAAAGGLAARASGAAGAALAALATRVAPSPTRTWDKISTISALTPARSFAALA